MIRWFKLCYLLFYFSIEFSFLIRYYSLLYQSLIPNCKLTINTLRQHISISDNIEQYIVGAASHRTSCQRLINFLLTRLYSDKDYMQFCYHLNIISVMTDLPYRLITGISKIVRNWTVYSKLQEFQSFLHCITGYLQLWDNKYCNIITVMWNILIYSYGSTEIEFLNQACASHRPAHAWFFEIAFVQEVGMCACVHVYLPQRALITTHVKRTRNNWLSKF